VSFRLGRELIDAWSHSAPAANEIPAPEQQTPGALSAYHKARLRLDQIEPNMVAVVPISFVGLELPGQHLEGEAGLLLDIREVVREVFRSVVV
jgi:hypothetical protein